MVRSEKGFTLVELMIVVVIIGILASIAVPKFGAIVTRAKLSELKKELWYIVNLERSYYYVSDTYIGFDFGNGSSQLVTNNRTANLPTVLLSPIKLLTVKKTALPMMSTLTVMAMTDCLWQLTVLKLSLAALWKTISRGSLLLILILAVVQRKRCKSPGFTPFFIVFKKTLKES